MDDKEFGKQVLDVVTDDSLRALSIASASLKDIWSKLTDDQRVVGLSAIASLAYRIRDRELSREPNVARDGEDDCDYCDKVHEPFELTQGHGGVICNDCVKLIFKGLEQN